MKKRKGHWCHCEECNSEHYIDDGDRIICDTCEENLCSENMILGWNGIIYHFCSLQCLFRFVIEELKKNNPRKNLEFGQDIDLQKGEEKQ